MLADVASFCQSAMLFGPDQAANSGDTVSLSLSLSSGGSAVSGLQFDLTWDPALDVHLATAPGIGGSTKILYTAFLQHRVLRCMIVGMNSTALIDGDVLRLFITVQTGTPPRAALLNIVNLSATDPNGVQVPLSGGSINVQIQSGSPSQLLLPSGIVNGASLAAGPISPGEIITLFGSISSTSPSVLLNGVPATILYAGLDQINAIVPFGLDLSQRTQVELRQNSSSTQISAPAAPASPAIFTLGSTGIGPGAILNQNYSVNSPMNPAVRGSVIMVYATGFGALTPQPADGQITQVLATTTSAVTATIDGEPADVLYAGVAPGLIAGVEQINVRVPAGVKPNPAAPISLSVGSFTTPAGVTVSVQ
jgi:uncharacterized protein (TIGR03437 family)